MKKWILLCAYLCCINATIAQDTTRRSVYVGLDLFKSVWPLVGLYPYLRSVYVIEPTVSVPLRKPFYWLHLTPGYTRFRERDYTAFNSSALSGQGYYLKVGIERRKRRFGVGGAGLLTAWQDEGTYRFRGTYFGDLVGTIPPKNHLAIGGEFFLSLIKPIKKRLIIRIQPRVSLLAPLTSQDERPGPAFLPGVGLSEGGRWRVSNGVSVQLFYRTSNRLQ